MAALAGNWAVWTLPCATVGASARGRRSRVNPNSSLCGAGVPCRAGAPRVAASCLFSGGHRDSPWGFKALPVAETGRALRNSAGSRSRPVRAAEEAAAQAEAGTKKVAEEEEEESGEPLTNGSADTPALAEEWKAAIAANDEESIAKLEAQVAAVQAERDALAKQVQKLVEESQTGRDRLLRLNADFDNFRKRSQAEKASLTSSVRGDVIETLLPMVDNFERAKAAIRVETEGEEKIDRSYQGIYKQIVEIMKGLGVVAVETVGKPFDPNVHEAIMREDSTTYEEGIVIQEFRRGFSIGSKLMRPAMVKVSAGPGPSQGDSGAEEAKGGHGGSEQKGQESS